MHGTSPDRHPRRPRVFRHRPPLVLVLAALVAAPVSAGVLPLRAPVAVEAADCPFPPELCPPSRPTPAPRPTPRPTPTPTPTAEPAPTAAPTPPPPPAHPSPKPTPKPSPSPSPAAAAPAPSPTATATPAPPAATPSPVTPPVTGVVPQGRSADPARTVGTATAASGDVHVWQVILAILVALALGALAVIRSIRMRRRAELHARYNRMRTERGLLPLTPKQIDFISRGRGY